MLLAPFLWIFCEFDEKVLDNLSLEVPSEARRRDSSGLRQEEPKGGRSP